MSNGAHRVLVGYETSPEHVSTAPRAVTNLHLACSLDTQSPPSRLLGSGVSGAASDAFRAGDGDTDSERPAPIAPAGSRRTTFYIRCPTWARVLSRTE